MNNPRPSSQWKLNRDVRRTECRKCLAPTLSGWDRDRCGLLAQVDDERLTRQGELLAAVTGRRTYAMWGRELHRRDFWGLASPHPDVYAEHRCWAPLPQAWLAPPVIPASPRTEMEF